MLNPAAIEALYSATYVENYLECVDHLPNELQRLITRIWELDMTFKGFLTEAQQQQSSLHELTGVEAISKKKVGLNKIQQALIAAQEVGDEKLEVVQQMQDLIENKARQLDTDYRNIADMGKDQDTQDLPIKESSNGLQTSTGNSSNGTSTGERASKRARRTRTDMTPVNEAAIAITELQASLIEPVRSVIQTQQPTPVATSTNTTQSKKTSSTSTGKKKKRKSRQSIQQTPPKEETPPPEEDMQIDPDEPTYCLCEQISYGEMIMCDNDLCPHEWFHFACVSLGVKPKGKWYCPKCRGDRSSIMKPKALFLKELERYNKEKELKDEKSS